MEPVEQKHLMDVRRLEHLLQRIETFGEQLQNNEPVPGLDMSDQKLNYGVGRGVVSVCKRIRTAINENELAPNWMDSNFSPTDISYKESSLRKIMILPDEEAI